MRIDPPDLPDELEPATTLDAGGLDCAALQGAELAGLRLVAASIDASRLERVDLTGAKLPNLAVRDSELRECALANADLRGASLRRTHVRGGRLTGLIWTEGEAADVVLEDCRADLAALAGTRLERVRFTRCNLAQADFEGARMKTVVFEDCDLRDADLSGARFEQVELRGCRLEGLRGAAALRGVAMPWSDVLDAAGLFAAACGVKVLADGE
ncbi:MAG: hypothetical protein QOE86_3527 [Solirubrobacteraceae bacterium]|nr:hypothetical protein [Solirubrobacteraceae bacterium]